VSNLAFPKLALNVCSSYTFVPITVFSVCTNVEQNMPCFPGEDLHIIFLLTTRIIRISVKKKKRHLWMNMLMRSCYILLCLFFFLHLLVLRPCCMRVANTQKLKITVTNKPKNTVCNLSRLGVEFLYYW